MSGDIYQLTSSALAENGALVTAESLSVALQGLAHNTQTALNQINGPQYFNFNPLQFPRWRKALANVRTGQGRARLSLTGDSTTAGFGAPGGNGYTNAVASSYCAWLAGLLNTYRVPAHRNSFFCDNGFNSVSGATPALVDPRLSLGAGWSNNGAATMGGLSFLNSTTTNAFTFTPAGAFDSIDIYYLAGASNGSFTVDIGAATLATVSTVGADGMVKVTVTTGATAATGLINVKRTGAGSVFIAGMDTYDSVSNKVSVWNQGCVGAGIGTIAAHAFNRAWQPSLIAAAPDLVICGIGVNDYRSAGSGITLASYVSQYQAFITAVTAVSDMIMLIEVPSATTSASADIQAQYVAAQYQLAILNNLPVIDLTGRFGSQAQGLSSGFYYDTLHLVSVGYNDVANAVMCAPGLF